MEPMIRPATVQPTLTYQRIADNLQQVIFGKQETVRLAIVALLAEGHLLIEDVPGLAKTRLARALARSVGGITQRIQFTPDLMPGDITGVMVYNQRSGTFDFDHGPVFANVVLADEINRGTPKTQSALLEAMAERSVTVARDTYMLPNPFMVLATQNPLEPATGTYRLPEAQLDRFLMRITIGYPDHDSEVRAVQSDSGSDGLDGLFAVVDLPALRETIAVVRSLRVANEIHSYAVRLAVATREHHAVRCGASPRGSIALIRAARAWAVTAGRAFVTPDDVKDVAQPVLAHRLVLKREAEGGRWTTARDVVTEVLQDTPAPPVTIPTPRG